MAMLLTPDCSLVLTIKLGASIPEKLFMHGR